MGVSYRPLRITLAEQNLKISQLKDMIGCSSTTIAKIGKDEPLNMRVIEDICRVLSVPIEKVVEFTD